MSPAARRLCVARNARRARGTLHMCARENTGARLRFGRLLLSPLNLVGCLCSATPRNSPLESLVVCLRAKTSIQPVSAAGGLAATKGKEALTLVRACPGPGFPIAWQVQDTCAANRKDVVVCRRKAGSRRPRGHSCGSACSASSTVADTHVRMIRQLVVVQQLRSRTGATACVPRPAQVARLSAVCATQRLLQEVIGQHA